MNIDHILQTFNTCEVDYLLIGGMNFLPWEACRGRAVVGQTAAGVEYRGLCDEDMLSCQLALPEGQRRQTRIESLRRAISISNQKGRQT